ncbi:MAG TPA: DedA family protein [Armatimonadota bacterium]|nr:DedA family protein [Armatimonadota bacterium]
MMQATLHWYFSILDQWGLLGVIVLMALESTIVPIPSEIVIPPVAYLESHAQGGAIFLTCLVIVAGTVGSVFGASLMYWIARWIGRPLMLRYGKYLFVTETKLKHAEEWVVKYGAAGILLARLLPGVRHLNPIPAGIIRMRFQTFALMTLVGSALWCTVLTIFGLVMAQEYGGLDPERRECRVATIPARGGEFDLGIVLSRGPGDTALWN